MLSRVRSPLSAVALLLLVAGPVAAQYAERPYRVNDGEEATDASGRSVKNPRVRAVHTTDPSLEGGTAYFFYRDPFLAYQLGRNMYQREFRGRDGVFSIFRDDLYGFEVGGPSDLGGPMKDGQTAKNTINNQTSCGACHNTPYGNPGTGVNFSKDSGFGRQTPHNYGVGLMEQIAIQIRTDVLAQIDTNADGWVDLVEAATAPDPIMIEASPGGAMVNFGSAKLDPVLLEPQLNQILRTWYGCDGYIPAAEYFGDLGTDKYSFQHRVFAWGQLEPEHSLNPTLRTFLWDPFITHMGLEAHDPSTLDDPDLDGVSEPDLAGAIQFPATHQAPDHGYIVDALGFSRDDPDEDGHLTEISEGDLDLGEWFLLNAPRPTFAGTPAEYDAGLALMNQLQCTSCHVADWQVKAQDETHPGDRRFIDFDVTWNPATQRLEGKLNRLYTKQGPTYARNFGSFLVKGIFTDFKHHEMGTAFEELEFDGFRQTKFRTAPLWGVGSGFPWGHDGRSLTLQSVIRRHGGEALASEQLYEAAGAATQAALIDFLSRLQLYDIESLPADIDGDGSISRNFAVAGKDTGTERFNAEWLFKRPVEIQGTVTPFHGDPIRSFAAMNLGPAYGLGLTYCKDSDLDGWPDVWDAAPTTPGYRDGVND